MLSVAIARQLRDAGLPWTPQRGDRFVVADRDMDDEVFVLSDMTIEVHHYPGGPVIGFNGTTEWALDSVEQQDALWVPAEHQLRELLGAAFVRLEKFDDAHRVVVSRAGAETLGQRADGSRRLRTCSFGSHQGVSGCGAGPPSGQNETRDTTWGVAQRARGAAVPCPTERPVLS